MCSLTGDVAVRAPRSSTTPSFLVAFSGFHPDLYSSGRASPTSTGRRDLDTGDALG